MTTASVIAIRYRKVRVSGSWRSVDPPGLNVSGWCQVKVKLTDFGGLPWSLLMFVFAAQRQNLARQPSQLSNVLII